MVGITLFELWCYRGILMISWKVKKTDDKMLKKGKLIAKSTETGVETENRIHGIPCQKE